MFDKVKDYLGAALIIIPSFAMQLVGAYVLIMAYEGHYVLPVFWLFVPYTVTAVAIIIYDVVVFYTNIDQTVNEFSEVCTKTIGFRDANYVVLFILGGFVTICFIFPGIVYDWYMEHRASV